MSAKKERMANFKTYEAQARLLAAVVASLPKNFRFDYKTIAKHYGERTTESAIEHRFRPLKVQAEALRAMVEQGSDPLAFPVVEWKTQQDIQKYFGESTVEGIGFQFRSIKKGAETLKAAADNGNSPVEAFGNLLQGGSGGRGSTPATPAAKRVRATKATGTTPASKRRRASKVELEPVLGSDDSDEDSPELDFSELDTTPTKIKPKPLTTPKKNPGELVPRSAWAKPTDKGSARKPAVRRNAPIAPAPPRASAPAAPPPGFASAAVPNGFTNPATGFGYNYVPSSAASSASPPAAHSPAASMATMRRGSAFSTGSLDTTSRPPTPSAPYTDPATTMATTTTTTAVSQYPPLPGTADAVLDPRVMDTAANTSNPWPTATGRDLFSNQAPSPPASVADAYTPQTNVSSSTMAASGDAASFGAEQQQQHHHHHAGGGFVGYAAAGSAANSFAGAYAALDDAAAAYSFAGQDTAAAGDASQGGFGGGFEEEEEEEQEQWDAGDC